MIYISLCISDCKLCITYISLCVSVCKVCIISISLHSSVCKLFNIYNSVWKLVVIFISLHSVICKLFIIYISLYSNVCKLYDIYQQPQGDNQAWEPSYSNKRHYSRDLTTCGNSYTSTCTRYMVAFSWLARNFGECSTIHFPPVLFLLKLKLGHRH